MMPDTNNNAALLISVRPDVCDLCGCCVGVCPEDAIELTARAFVIVGERCTNCAKCVWVCPFEALFFTHPADGTP